MLFSVRKVYDLPYNQLKMRKDKYSYFLLTVLTFSFKMLYVLICLTASFMHVQGTDFLLAPLLALDC